MSSLARRPLACALLALALLCGPTRAAEDPLNRAVELKRAGDFRGAERLLKAVVSSPGHDWRGWYNLGNLYAAMRDPTAAVAAFARALEMSPSNADVANNFGNALKDSGFCAVKVFKRQGTWRARCLFSKRR
jgi:Tfp pilus assembly protein PilF